MQTNMMARDFTEWSFLSFFCMGPNFDRISVSDDRSEEN